MHINKDYKYPNGVYISVKLTQESEDKLNDYIDKYLQNIERNTEFHCTLIYSVLPMKKCPMTAKYNAKSNFENFNIFGPDNNILVCEINSPKITYRHKLLMKMYNFSYDFETYKPHISIGYNIDKNLDISKLPDINFSLDLYSETVEKLNENYKG